MLSYIHIYDWFQKPLLTPGNENKFSLRKLTDSLRNLTEPTRCNTLPENSLRNLTESLRNLTEFERFASFLMPS